LNDRVELTKEEHSSLDEIKDSLTKFIEKMKENGVRSANIEIELIWHIKKVLRGE